jgi:drug/metabolite transporter (DMT)-like permease
MELLFSVLASTLIFLLFKVFPRWEINTFQAVVSNYFTAFLCGFLLFHRDFSLPIIVESLPIVLVCGTLFISLFVIMGLSSQHNGVSSTSVAVKMSMALSVLIVIALGKETTGFIHIASLGLAMIGVYFVSSPSGSSQISKSTWMLVVLFFGSSALDVVLFAINRFLMPEGLSDGVFSSLGFLLAGTMGLSYLTYQLVRNKIVLDWKSWIAGIVLGIPNYFSIYLLISSYSSINLPASKVLAIANLGVVVLSTGLGNLLFKEKFSAKKILGLAFSLLSLLLLLSL